MNHSVYFDSSLSDDARRAALFDGQLFVYSAREPVRRFVQFARRMIEDAFAPLNPETAQYELSVERYAQILAELKPAFIHHPESKRHIQAILADLGCDLESTYFDVPRLRTSTSDAYLTTGIAYAWHPHRDTWYSAPPCQINYWLPIFELSSDNAMAFHPAYWNTPVRNDSHKYNYYVWNRLHRGPEVSKLIKEDPRPLPRATEEIKLDPQLRLICPVGGLLIFSGAQMHSSVPNTSGRTRFSIDFRTVHIDDARQRRGAPSCDEACTGTTMRDYLRATDFARLPEDTIVLYDDGTADRGNAVYQPR
jgi:hypothetical protein